MNRLTWCLVILCLLSLGQYSLAAEGWLGNGVSSSVGFVGRRPARHGVRDGQKRPSYGSYF